MEEVKRSNDSTAEVAEILIEYLKKATEEDASDADKANIPLVARLLFENTILLC